MQTKDNGSVTRGWIDGFISFSFLIHLFSWASILLRSVNPCLLQGKMCDRGGIELLQSKNENGWRSLDWHQPHRISFSGRGPCVVTWLGTNSGIGTTYEKGNGGDDLTSVKASWTQLICWTLSLNFVALSTEQPCKNRSGMGSYWGGGRTLSRHDSRNFWSIIINWIYSAFSLVPPHPLYLDDLKCFIYVLMMFFYQPCLGWDQVLSC